MGPFRRPLGILLFAVLVIVLGVILGEVGANVPGDPWWLGTIGGWLIVLAVIAILGSLVVVAWRLVRRPRNAEERPATPGEG
jgi:heme/copper-type cytochrome/quinol oxidase subunit 2